MLTWSCCPIEDWPLTQNTLTSLLTHVWLYSSGQYSTVELLSKEYWPLTQNTLTALLARVWLYSVGQLSQKMLAFNT